MLYNKDWNKAKVAPADPMSLDGLIAWLETKNPTERHHFSDSSQCMLAQWVKHLDPKAYSASLPMNSYVYLVNGQTVDFKHTVFNRVAATDGCTFGVALEKAKTYRGRK